MQPVPQPVPGIYAGGGLATLLRANEQTYLFQNQPILAGQASIAVQLERMKSSYYYPWGAAFQVFFSGAPGTFEVDIQFSETDEPNSYVSVGTINAVNASNYARYDMPNTVFPRFVRGLVKTLPNAVNVTLVATR